MHASVQMVRIAICSVVDKDPCSVVEFSKKGQKQQFLITKEALEQEQHTEGAE